jgi:hypothetical protein
MSAAVPLKRRESGRTKQEEEFYEEKIWIEMACQQGGSG